jgi:polyhydroxybutyrate depolymerase
LYSQFNAVADEEGFIVVYANAINNNWDLFGASDVNFISHLVDTLRNRFSTNNCLFSMGMSQGGFLSYKLSCELDHSIAAIAVVTGNMLEAWQTTCSAPGVSVMHFHGTADQVVNYNGSFGISPVEETVQWWADENICNPTPYITALPDINTNDNSTVEEYKYNTCSDGSNVFLYKVINGGHTWPGAFPIQSLGNTNQDIDASEIIGDFFELQCDIATGNTSNPRLSIISLYPNPASNSFTILWPGEIFNIKLYDLSGQTVLVKNKISEKEDLDSKSFQPGIYFLRVTSLNKFTTFQKLIIQ